MSAAVIPFVRQPPKLIVPHLEAKRQDVRTRKVGIQLTDAVVAGMINLLRDGLARWRVRVHAAHGDVDGEDKDPTGGGDLGGTKRKPRMVC